MRDRPQKITFAEMRASGIGGILVNWSDYRCSHSVEMTADRWPGDASLSDIEDRFVCTACGKRGADVRPDFNWDRKEPVGGVGHRRQAHAAELPPRARYDRSE